jgi:hypothetical protein
VSAADKSLGSSIVAEQPYLIVPSMNFSFWNPSCGLVLGLVGSMSNDNTLVSGIEDLIVSPWRSPGAVLGRHVAMLGTTPDPPSCVSLIDWGAPNSCSESGVDSRGNLCTRPDVEF